MKERGDNTNYQRNTNKVFENAQEAEEQKEKPEPVKPKYNFGGLKKALNRQNEDNTEANKGLEEY